jgi:hypothetical protein
LEMPPQRKRLTLILVPLGHSPRGVDVASTSIARSMSRVMPGATRVGVIAKRSEIYISIRYVTLPRGRTQGAARIPRISRFASLFSVSATRCERCDLRLKCPRL